MISRILWIAGCIASAAASCISQGDQRTINSVFKSGGAGTVVQLCPTAVITITGTIQFTADHQELSTQGYPTDNTRAIIKLNAQGGNASTLISGSYLSGIRLLNIQVDGDRAGNGFLSGGGANIEVGGGGNGLVVSHVASRNPRGWSCLHIIEGGISSNVCTNATVTNNDIGPCGQEGTNAAGQGRWADGISFACTHSLVSGNKITGSTDGGIVIFGAPGTRVTKNTLTSSSTNKGFGAIVHSPNAAFADDASCPYATQLLFNQSPHFSYWKAGLKSPYSLQSGFVQAIQEPYYFICPTGPLPSTQTFGPNGLSMAPGTVAQLHDNILITYQTDNNLVVYNTSSASWIPEWASGHTLPNGASCGRTCDLVFQGDGNLVTYANGKAMWETYTNGKGKKLVFRNRAPWIEVLDASGTVIWSTASA
ncbi:hypothetical protein BZG36_03103 [Bifiguratus adelaidae]|uniref:Bulb-type lectin domain-containing protein n=1 Tax=Bifiguratus adelaidae TaxID=1938954 RepID=A0A261XYW8_9FUNG|nr:hypothetical protein BZG36_03103 [Bifiguratus adelaidae]